MVEQMIENVNAQPFTFPGTGSPFSSSSSSWDNILKMKVATEDGPLAFFSVAFEASCIGS